MTASEPLEKLLEKSKAIRRGEYEKPNEAFRVAKELAALQRFEQARLLAKYLVEADFEPDKPILLRQRWALWTSKNPDAPDDSKHDDALEILDGIEKAQGGASLATTTDPETLGIAGGICKRKWLVDGRRETLEQSLMYYERGAKQGIEADNGYTAINAAFIHDLVATMEGAEADGHRRRAAELRGKILTTPLPKDTRWLQETLAEAHFGLRDYANAETHLKMAYEQPVDPWEFETTARQFAALARLHDPDVRTNQDFVASRAWGVLRAAYGDSATKGAGSLFAGKFGLGLSGGGFRASFFHIGVLAALAERDMLRHVETLSCVSGGSIVGAHYYLEIRKLLQAKSDDEITRNDYIELVERLAREFLAGVQKNIRTRVAGSLLGNLRMAFQPGFTNSKRLGDLYEKHLYARVHDDGERVLQKLRVAPKGVEKCNPKYDNWRRSNKVPILVLNAATENTGHNWQFTASWMGEPPSRIDSEVDGNYRLRRMYYEGDHMPERHRDIRIGQAVAASSAVPGLFTPIELQGLYDGITVRLVDGGVHDNQGLYGLLDQNCNVMLVSDASGQMSTVDRPPDDPLGVLLRTTSMLQARVRTAQYREVEGRRKTKRLKGLLFVHLKKDLEVESRDWIGCDNPKETTAAECLRRGRPLTSYGVLKELQEHLSGIRTDLDSFSDTEAFALMASGCKMVRKSFDGAIEGFQVHDEEHDWPFMSVESALKDSREESLKSLSRLLKVGGLNGFKVWQLSRVLRVIGLALGAAVALGLLWVLYRWHDAPLWSPEGMAAALALAGVTLVLARLGLQWIVRIVNYRKTVYQIATGAALSIFGWAAVGIHLLIFDRWFLRKGKLASPNGEGK